MYRSRSIAADAETFSSITDEWNALCSEGPCADPFLRPEWFRSLIDAFGLKARLITVRRDSELRAVLPVMNGRAMLHGLPVRSLRSVFNPNTPRLALIRGSDDDEQLEILRVLWQEIFAYPNWDVFETRLARRQGWFSGLIDLAANERCRTGIWRMDSAPFVELVERNGNPISVAEYFKGPRKHLARELDRRARRLAEQGEVEICVTKTYSDALIDRYLLLETKGWKDQKGTAAMQDPRAADLHHRFARSMALLGRLHSYELRLDGQTIAMSLNISDRNRIFHWKTTFDERFSKYGPGNQLFRRLLVDAVESGFEEIDLLSPSVPYKRVWATNEREHAAFYVFRPGFAGSAAWAWKFQFISRLRKFKVLSNYGLAKPVSSSIL